MIEVRERSWLPPGFVMFECGGRVIGIRLPSGEVLNREQMYDRIAENLNGKRFLREFAGQLRRLLTRRKEVPLMPAKSKAQLRAAAAAAARGESWGKEMIEKTRTTKGLPERKRKPKRKVTK